MSYCRLQKLLPGQPLSHQSDRPGCTIRSSHMAETEQFFFFSQFSVPSPVPSLPPSFLPFSAGFATAEPWRCNPASWHLSGLLYFLQLPLETNTKRWTKVWETEKTAWPWAALSSGKKIICVSTDPWSEVHCQSVRVAPFIPWTRSWQGPVIQLQLSQPRHWQAADELTEKL